MHSLKTAKTKDLLFVILRGNSGFFIVVYFVLFLFYHGQGQGWNAREESQFLLSLWHARLEGAQD
jgi:hypothetical protein